MSASTPHVGKFARSLCWSMAGPDAARPHPQTIKPKLQKISPLNPKALALTTASVAQPSRRPPRPRSAASTAALKSP